MTPITALHHQAETRPESTAFIMGGDVWSYARFAAEVDRLARGLSRAACDAGDRVALHLWNGPEIAIAYHACFRIGAIAAPLNTRLKSAELDSLLRRLRPALYIGQANLYAKVAGTDPMNSSGQCTFPRRWRRHRSSRAALDQALHRHYRRILARPGGYECARLAADDLRHHGRARNSLPIPCKPSERSREDIRHLGPREWSYRRLRRAHGSCQRGVLLARRDPAWRAADPDSAIRSRCRARCDRQAPLHLHARAALHVRAALFEAQTRPARGRSIRCGFA